MEIINLLQRPLFKISCRMRTAEVGDVWKYNGANGDYNLWRVDKIISPTETVSTMVESNFNTYLGFSQRLSNVNSNNYEFISSGKSTMFYDLYTKLSEE
jgi:hypothetical protein